MLGALTTYWLLSALADKLGLSAPVFLRPPQPPELPTAAWINKPDAEEVAQ